MTFSNTLYREGSIEIGRQFEYKLGSLTLNTGTILSVFRHNGTEIVEIYLFSAVLGL